MKKYIKQLLIAVVAIFLSSGCNDNFLDKLPLDKVTNESFWRTEDDLRVYNNSIYHLSTNRGTDNLVPFLMGLSNSVGSYKYGYWYYSGFSDDTGPRTARSNNYQIVRAGRRPVPETPFIYGYGGWGFLRAINVGLDNYGRAEVTEQVRNKYIGEARLLRAWFYHDKVSKFGDNQWVDTELNIDDEEILYGPRDDRDFVMGKVLEDLNFAVANIPEDWGTGESPGRLNRWAALLVKARVALFEGTWQKYHGGSNASMWLQEAADAAKELMDDGPYSLYTTGNPDVDYSATHHETSDLTGNPEVIYWRRGIKGVAGNMAVAYHRQHFGGATKSLVEDYLCTDGLPITLSPLYKGDAVYEDIFENRDPRLRQTILHPADQAIYRYGNHDFDTYSYPRIWGMSGGIVSQTGYHIIKTYDNYAAFIAGWDQSETPAILLRFGEALLIYAEAKAELGTITQSDLDMSINLLRDRVAMPHMDINNIPVDPRYIGDGVSPLIVEIRRERRLELFMEGFRYDDLRRWKQGAKLRLKDFGMRWDQANADRFDPEGRVKERGLMQTSLIDGVEYIEVYKGTPYEIPLFDEEKDYLWPLPLSALSQNPNLGQNPGW